MPPPSSGGIALSQLLMMLSNFTIDTIEHNSIHYIHLLMKTVPFFAPGIAPFKST